MPVYFKTTVENHGHIKRFNIPLYFSSVFLVSLLTAGNTTILSAEQVSPDFY